MWRVQEDGRETEAKNEECEQTIRFTRSANDD